MAGKGFGCAFGLFVLNRLDYFRALVLSQYTFYPRSRTEIPYGTSVPYERGVNVFV